MSESTNPPQDPPKIQPPAVPLTGVGTTTTTTTQTSTTPGSRVLGWSMGLEGAWKTVANLTAVGLISLLFYQLVRDMVVQIREERTMFREELGTLRQDNSRGWEVIRSTERAMKELTESIRNDREMIRLQTDQIRILAAQINQNQRGITDMSDSVGKLIKEINVFRRRQSPEKPEPKNGTPPLGLLGILP